MSPVRVGKPQEMGFWVCLALLPIQPLATAVGVSDFVALIAAISSHQSENDALDALLLGTIWGFPPIG